MKDKIEKPAAFFSRRSYLRRAREARAAVRCQTLADRATHAVADRDSRHTFSATVSFDKSYEDGQAKKG